MKKEENGESERGVAGGEWRSHFAEGSTYSGDRMLAENKVNPREQTKQKLSQTSIDS